MTAATQPVAKTGIAGLDVVLGGGFPKDHVYLIQGDPGAGKTTLSLQFLLEGDTWRAILMNVLVADDDETIRALVTRLFARRGDTVQSAADGEAAILCLDAESHKIGSARTDRRAHHQAIRSGKSIAPCGRWNVGGNAIINSGSWHFAS